MMTAMNDLDRAWLFAYASGAIFGGMVVWLLPTILVRLGLWKRSNTHTCQRQGFSL